MRAGLLSPFIYGLPDRTSLILRKRNTIQTLYAKDGLQKSGGNHGKQDETAVHRGFTSFWTDRSKGRCLPRSQPRSGNQRFLFLTLDSRNPSIRLLFIIIEQQFRCNRTFLIFKHAVHVFALIGFHCFYCDFFYILKIKNFP